jgi:drug/metabolite transporter (DMT)-like permease
MTTQHSGDRRAAPGIALAALAAIGFSAKAILVKLAYAKGPVDPITLLALRMLFSVPFFLLAAFWNTKGRHNPLARRDLPVVLILGIIGYYLSSLFDFMGLQYISAGLERLILFLYPTFVVLLSALFLKRPIGSRDICALLLSYSGIGLVVMHDLAAQPGGELAWGAVLVFASTLTYAAYLIGIGTVIAKLGVMRLTASAMLVASVATLLQFLLTHPLSDLVLPASVYGLALAMAIFSTVLPVFMLSASIRLIGSSHTALIGSIGPVATLFLAYVFLGETVSARQMAGAALVLTGVLIISLWKK